MVSAKFGWIFLEKDENVMTTTTTTTDNGQIRIRIAHFSLGIGSAEMNGTVNSFLCLITFSVVVYRVLSIE